MKTTTDPSMNGVEEEGGGRRRRIVHSSERSTFLNNYNNHGQRL
jgi:hypothetical protein